MISLNNYHHHKKLREIGESGMFEAPDVNEKEKLLRMNPCRTPEETGLKRRIFH